MPWASAPSGVFIVSGVRGLFSQLLKDVLCCPGLQSLYPFVVLVLGYRVLYCPRLQKLIPLLSQVGSNIIMSFFVRGGENYALYRAKWAVIMFFAVPAFCYVLYCDSRR